MRLSTPSTVASLLLPALVSANVAWRPDYLIPQITPAPTINAGSSQPQQTPSNQIPVMTPIPTSIPPTHTHAWDPIISGASRLLSELDDHLLHHHHHELHKRQGGVGATNAVDPAITKPTQIPPVTVYDMNDGKLLTYTQIFLAVNEQWPSPEPGTIGLGTIQGQIGVVKSNSKRAAEAWAEPTPMPGQVMRIKGREVTLS